MASNSLRELFVEELRDMYDAEKRLTKALPKLAKAATSTALQSAFTNHARETEQQVTRLEEVFRSIGETPRGKKCDGIIGIIEEGNAAMQELDGVLLDAALIAGAQKAEHYEIASYGTLAYFAEILGANEAKNLLGETLDEEKAADEKLSTIAKSKVNREALARGSDESEVAAEIAESDSGLFNLRARRGTSSSVAMANDRSSKRSRTASRGGSSRSSGGSSSRSSSVRRSSKKR